MRTVGFLVLLCLGCALGCKTKGDADAAPDPEALKARKELLAKRDALLEQRKKLETSLDGIDIEIKDAKAAGKDTTELEKKKKDVEAEMEKSTVGQLDELNGKLDAMKLSGDKSSQLAVREAEVANREKELANRVAKVVEMETRVAQQEAAAAQRWKDSCNTGGPAMIIQQVAPKGGNYTKSDVSQMIQKAKAAMARKGIMTSDLPGPAQTLEAEAGKALNDNDMSKAYFAAAQLSGTVDSIQINRGFIQTKYNRLQAQVKGLKVDEATNKEWMAVLNDVMQKYGDGDLNAANKRLNGLAASLAKQ